jgi:hypothetical protein
MGDVEDVRDWMEPRREHLLAELIGWVRIRSVAGVPEHAIELRRSAQWLAGTLREVGFPTVEVWPTDGGGPAVFAEWPAPAGDAPAVLVYSHHDVRAAHDDTWEQTPPFEPTLREGRLFGRGTSDAKGQVLTHLWGLRAWLAQGHDGPPVTLRCWSRGRRSWAHRTWRSCSTSGATAWAPIWSWSPTPCSGRPTHPRSAPGSAAWCRRSWRSWDR